MSNYDSIVIGGGHNGLVCASYLAKNRKKADKIITITAILAPEKPLV